MKFGGEALPLFGLKKDGNGYKIPVCPQAIDPLALGKDTGV